MIGDNQDREFKSMGQPSKAILQPMSARNLEFVE
jgi:hypothetical protein